MSEKPRTVVFLGPSLSREEAARLCPHASIRPPARKGDLISAVLDDDVSVIGLIDGEFDQSLSVWHKEILYAMESGVTVLGSSSMGALRAAELHPWGMHGVGQVFRAYRDGEIIDDDEVALVFAELEGSYLKSSEPMINIRASCRAAAAAGAVSPGLADRAVVLTKRLPYPERSYRRMLQLLESEGEPPGEVASLRDHLAEHAVDVKSDDARELLRLLEAGPPPPGPRPDLARTVAFDTMFHRERPLGRGDTAVTVDEVAHRFRDEAPDGETTREAALNRGFLLMMGRLFRIEPAPQEIRRELERIRARHGLTGDAELRDWLERQRTSETELRTLAREEAVCATLRRWLAGALSTEGEGPLLMSYLRLHGRLEEWLPAMEGRR